MSPRAVRVAGAAVVVAAAAAVVMWVLARPAAGPEPPAPAGFEFERPKLVSPRLDVDLEFVRGTLHEGYADWSCLFVCNEPDGCYGTVQVRIAYRSGAEAHQLMLGGRFDGASGDTMRLGRVQRPPPAVTRIDSVTLELLDSSRPGDPTPTPME